MRFSDLFETSSSALKANKSRSALTILGIVIGIAAVILMLSVGRSAEGLILSQVADLGSDLVFVEPAAGDPMAGPPNPFIEQSLDLDDLEALEESGLFLFLDGNLVTTAVVFHDESSEFSQIVGLTPDNIDIFPADIKRGRFITDSDLANYARVAVLGSEIAVDLFGDQNPIDQKIKVNNISLRIVGVYDEQGTRFFQNLDKQIAIPLTTAQRDVFGIDYITYFVGRAAGDIENTKEDVRFILRDTHNIDNASGDISDDNFFVSSQDDAVEIIGVVGDILTLLLASIAAVSLLVGGIGIMNIMLVSVTERTKEIGLRKSIGATRNEILQQFLLESVLLTLVGGIFGVLLGIAASLGSGWIVQQYLADWEANIPVSAIFLAVFVATAVGIIFGIYPAQRAAKLDPIEALRYE